MKITNIKVRIAVISTNQKWLVLISLNLVLVNPWDLETLKSIVARSHHSGRSSPNFNPTYFSEPWTFFYNFINVLLQLLVVLFLHTTTSDPVLTHPTSIGAILMYPTSSCPIVVMSSTTSGPVIMCSTTIGPTTCIMYIYTMS